LNQFTEFKF